jgi:hypothetical protein
MPADVHDASQWGRSHQGSEQANTTTPTVRPDLLQFLDAIHISGLSEHKGNKAVIKLETE